MTATESLKLDDEAGLSQYLRGVGFAIRLQNWGGFPRTQEDW
jgi:hypothetical protein